MMGAGVDGDGVGMRLPVLLLPKAAELGGSLGLPKAGENLFGRLIRNPHADSEYAKERGCAEMVCVLLQNCPTLRMGLLKWMAGLVGMADAPIDSLEFEFGTETYIGLKRDDLRITGYQRTDDALIRTLEWTVEVKVQSGIHRSSALATGEEEEAEEATERDQLSNYDQWLREQDVKYRAGFVLTLERMDAELFGHLKCDWASMTWTGLGEQIAAVLQYGPLGEAESVLAKHALGFIQKRTCVRKTIVTWRR